VLDAVKGRKRTTHVLLSEATVLAVEGTTLVLTHANAPLARRLSEDGNMNIVREALREVLGVDWRLRYEGGGPGGQGGGARAAAAPGRTVSAAASATPASAPVRETVADDGGWPTVRAVPSSPEPTPPAAPATGGPPLEEPPPEEEPDFDPYEEPGDDTARVSVEDTALALLQQQLGARKISED
jgi:DNA polymerase-3 subunit gamma/tau